MSAPHAHAQERQLVMQLQELFDIADKHNSSIKSYLSAVEVADAAYRAALTAVLPDVEVGLSLSYNGNGRVWDRDFSNTHVASIPHFGNAAHIKVSLPLYTGGAISSGIALSRQGKQMAQLDVESQRSDMRMLITRLYLMIHSLKNREQVLDDNITLTIQELELMRQRCGQGIVLQNDVSRYELVLEKLKLALTQVRNQESIVNHQLVKTLGLDSAVCVVLPGDSFGLEAMSPSSEDEWLSMAALNAHCLKKASLAIDMSREQERLERAALLPTVGLVFEDNFSGPITIEIPALNKNFNYWYVGVGVTYNLSSLFKDKKKVLHAQAATRQALDSRQAVSDHIDVAVQAAYVDYQTALASLDTHRKNVQLAADSYDIVRNRYDNGLALITDLLDVANEKLNAELSLVEARISVIENYFNIKYISGTL